MVTKKLFNVRSCAHSKTTFRRCCEKLFIPLLIVLVSLGSSPDLLAQDDSPCECVQRWEKGAHWNEDGSINDAPNAPEPLGVIRCANAAETQSQIKPNGCTYNPAEFTIDVSGSDCIDPSTGASVAVDNPTEGEPIIWFNFDARPHSSEFEVQINDNSGDRIGFALYYSSTSTSGLNENGVSGDCSSLILVACGVESSNTWNTLPVPDFDQPTNYYLAIWDQDADGDLKVNNFKARFGCSEGDPDEPDCALDLIECPETAKVSCGDPIDPVTLGLLPETCSTIEVDYSDVIGGVCTDNLSIKRIWTFKDPSGNMSNCEQLIEFVDETAPTIEAIEDFVLEDCEAEWPALSTEWSDNCGSGGQVEGEPGEVMVDGCTETLVYTFTVSDDCGNETSITTTVTRELDELVIACPADKTMETCASQEDIDAAFTAFLEAFMIESGCNASGGLDAEYTAPDKCGGEVEVSYTATTDCGEPQSCSATFTVPECTTGECSDCPEACAISGDQEVCPNEMATYMVEVEEGCENPEIIWSLNEAYNGATIIAQDGNSVTLEFDNNCEGWVELIATIKCDGCEDLVCKYPIDVVLTDIVFETPDEVVIDACTDAASIEAAFDAFLEGFSVSGGCNAVGEFEKEYSLPEVCGGSIEVVYNAVADCGQVTSTSATFTIENCEEESCDECPESCAISGDQQVCTGDLVTYKVAIPEGCENPEVIWSLNETYDDATIVGEDPATNSIVLKIDNNCDAWVELIATIKCDGCEDIVCKYPIDVVLTDLVLDCPADVMLEPCSTQEDIDAAFAEFLEAFTFEGGCDAEGAFETEYSAPDKCGGMVEVKYLVTESCGETKTCSATFSIENCGEGECDECPESCAISGDQLVCPGEIVSYTVEVDQACENPQVIWSLNETYNDATIVSTEGNSVVLKIDDNCEAWVELIATIKCEGCEDVVCNYPIDVVLTDLVLDCPADVVMEPCSTQEDIDAAFTEFLEAFTFEGGCDAEGAFETEYSAPDKCGGIVEVKYLVTESCGETKICSATFSIDICEDGTCNTCEGSCLIDGKIAACPGEELVYTLDLDGACAEPEIIWTLDGDAEIIETGDGQVTIKATDECEGWFTLKATINCENCPAVACEKMVDIVRHKLVPECPGDVAVEACLSESEVNTAFEAFLNSFGFSGGCGDAYADFAMEYTAPTACGESVTVEYMVQDNCGQHEICTATFRIKDCEQECTPEIKDLEDILLEECGAEWPVLETQWWDDCGNEGKVVGESGEVMTVDDCYQYRIYTFTIFNACGENAQTTTKVTRAYDETAPIVSIPNLNIELVSCIDDIPSPEGLEAIIEVSLFDNCDESPDIMISAEGAPECIDGSFSYTYSVKVCDECGNCDEISVTYSGSCNGTPGEEQTFCTLTQGGWGNPGGKYPWKDGEKAGTEEIITALMDAYGDILIGDTLANVLRITDPECVLSLLPGGGTPDVLPEGDVTASSDNDCTPYSEEYLTGSGRLENNLAAQAIALQLNIWYTFEVSGSELGALSLESLSLEETDLLPDTVTNVAELLEFANLYLGGTLEGELAGSLTEMLSAVNEFFDGCSEVAFDECGLFLGLLDDLDLGLGDDEAQEEEEETESGILGIASEQPLKVWPNPASKYLTIAFESEEEGESSVRLIDPSGKRVFDGMFPVTIGDNNLMVPIDGFPTGIYTIMTVQGDRQLLERVVITKR